MFNKTVYAWIKSDIAFSLKHLLEDNQSPYKGTLTECFTSEHAAIGYLILNLKQWEITQLTSQRSPLMDSVKKKKQDAKKYNGILVPLNCWVSNLTTLAPLLLSSYLLVLVLKEMATHSGTLACKIPWTEKASVHAVAESRIRLSDFTFTLLLSV